MNADRLTTKSQQALSDAAQHAGGDGHAQLEPVHLLEALLAQSEGTAVPLLQAVGADPAAVRSSVTAELARLPRVSGSTVSAATP